MERWVRCFALCMLVFQAPMFGTTDWTVIAEKLEQSVMQISADCSAFAIDEERDFALTAKHCTNEDPTKPTIVGLIPSSVVADDVQFDLTVLRVPGMEAKALKLAADEPKAGTEVGTWGYGYGLKRAMFRHAWIGNRRMNFPGLDGEWIMFDNSYVGGQSGSPIVNAAGEIVAIVQMTTDRVGFGRGADIIRDRVGKYFAKPKQP
jgi:S1-C subfamily serine protease